VAPQPFQQGEQVDVGCHVDLRRNLRFHRKPLGGLVEPRSTEE
jgi:hypothetical protein